MRHPRYHKQAQEAVGVTGADLLLHGRKVVDRVVRLNELIVPAVIRVMRKSKTVVGRPSNSSVSSVPGVLEP